MEIILIIEIFPNSKRLAMVIFCGSFAFFSD